MNVSIESYLSYALLNIIFAVHASRDRILLDGEDVRSDDEGDEEEVFALKGMPDDSEDDDEEEDDGYGDEDEDDDNLEELAAQVAKANAKAAAKKAKGKQKQGPPSSSDGSDSDSEEEGWGQNKAAYYSSNAAQLDSEDEEANEMEEQEAKRLQTKSRDVLADDDFGLDDIPEVEPEEQPYAFIFMSITLDLLTMSLTGKS